jgi:hypothetical protein
MDGIVQCAVLSAAVSSSKKRERQKSIMRTLSSLSLLFLFLGVIVLLFVPSSNAIVHPKKNDKSKSNPPVKPKPAVKLNVDILPPLLSVLDELDFKDYVKNFVKMGVSETRLLLKLSQMDFQMMQYDWPDFTDDKLKKLKEKIKALTEMATIPDIPENPELENRRKLQYGRIYLKHGVTSFEFRTGSFGGHPPHGLLHMDISTTVYECNPETEADAEKWQTINYHKRMVVVKRGICPFVEKALNAFRHNASGVIVINSEDKIESPSSGVGIFPNITDAMLQPLKSFSVLAVANTSGEALISSVKFHQQLSAENYPQIAVIPLKCHTGGKCLPVTKAEEEWAVEILSGHIRVKDKTAKKSRSFEFLTSNYGGDLPTDYEYLLQHAQPIDLCQLSSSSPTSFTNPDQEVVEAVAQTSGDTVVPAASNSAAAGQPPKILVAHRGKCRFDIKSLHAQQLGARMLVVVDVEDQPLQRLGGSFPDLGFIGIPSILVTKEAGDFIDSLLAAEGHQVVAEVTPSRSSQGFDNWLELAYTEWSEDENDHLRQLQGFLQKFQEGEHWDIVAWLKRRIQEIELSKRMPIQTDA